MPSGTNPQEVKSGRIWDCLYNKDVNNIGPQEDLIGLDDVVGITFFEDNGRSLRRYRVVESLPEEKQVIASLEGGLNAQAKPGDSKFGYLLVANQVIAGDLLRPPPEAKATRFSRKLLSFHLNIPPATLAQLGQQTTWFFDFEGFETQGLVRCEGLATGAFSFLRVFDEHRQVFAAIIICHPFLKRQERQRLLSELDYLAYFSRDPSYLPYLVIMLSLRIESRLVNFHAKEARQTDLDLQRFATQKRPDEIFGETHSRAGALAAVDINVRNTLKLAGKSRKLVMRRPKDISNDEWSSLQSQKREVREGLDYCVHLLQTYGDTAKQTQDQTTRQLTTTLNMMAYEQQKLTRSDQQTGIQIAEASKVIAEETKKDSYSMKTLAVVTMIFLPATSVSSILAMPLFQWDRPWVISKWLWVYFAFAVPLTGLTIGLWWMWQRRAVNQASRKMSSKC